MSSTGLTSVKRGIQDERWEQLRPTIIRLYGQGMRYDCIRKYMHQQHGFVASDAAFKRHFKAWNLRRHATEDDFRLLAMIIRDLSIELWEPEQRPHFWVRGRQLDYYSVQRSIKKLQILPESLDDVHTQLDHIKLVHPQTSPYQPLTTPADLALPELALLKTQQIYKLSSIYDQTGAYHLRRCQDFYGWTMQAINQGQHGNAREHVNAALNHLELATRQGTLALSPLVCYATVQAQTDPSEKVRAYLQRFLDTARGLIELKYSTNHPFAITFRALHQTDLREELSIRILELIRDQIYMNSTRDDRLSHELSDEVEVILLDALRQLGQLNKAISHCHGVINHRAQLFPAFHTKRLAAQNTLANCCLSKGDLGGAETALQIVFNAEESPNAKWPRSFTYFETLRLQSVILRQQVKYPEAEQLLEYTLRELASPDIDQSQLEAIVFGVMRMMNQNGHDREAEWLRVQLSDLVSEVQQGGANGVLRMNRLVSEYFAVFGTRM